MQLLPINPDPLIAGQQPMMARSWMEKGRSIDLSSLGHQASMICSTATRLGQE
jgi:hypothetical protein